MTLNTATEMQLVA